MNALTPLLDVDGATAARGPFRLGPVSLRVGRGGCVGVLGPNGAGKSTLLALAAGEMAPVAGSVRLGGDDASRLARDVAARRVAVLRPLSVPAFDLCVLDLVLHGRWAHQQGWRFASHGDVELAREALRRVGLERLEARAVRTLSSGEVQRALLAKALAQGAPLLLLDEPTASLDIGQRAAVRKVVEVARGAGLGQVIVTHDVELAGAECETVLLLREGRCVAEGPAGDVLTAPLLSETFGVAVRVERSAEGAFRVSAEGS